MHARRDLDILVAAVGARADLRLVDPRPARLVHRDDVAELVGLRDDERHLVVAVDGAADLESFERHGLTDARVAAFRAKVRMELDKEVDVLYPRCWVGKVRVTTTDGRSFSARIDEPKGDPGNTLTRDELEAKAIRLAGFRSGATPAEMAAAIERIWRLDSTPGPPAILPRGT